MGIGYSCDDDPEEIYPYEADLITIRPEALPRTVLRSVETDFDLYQAWTKLTAEYPGCDTEGNDALAYCALGLTGEAGEVADKIKKILRGDKVPPTREAIAKELGDVLWYAARLAKELGYSLGEVIDMNKKKIEARKAAGNVKGSGDNR